MYRIKTPFYHSHVFLFYTQLLNKLPDNKVPDINVVHLFTGKLV